MPALDVLTAVGFHPTTRAAQQLSPSDVMSLDEKANLKFVQQRFPKAQIVDMGRHGRFEVLSVLPGGVNGKIHKMSDYKTGDLEHDTVLDDFDPAYFAKRISKVMDKMGVPKRSVSLAFAPGHASGWMYPASGSGGPIFMNRSPSAAAKGKYSAWKAPRSPHTCVHEYGHLIWHNDLSSAQKKAFETYYATHIAPNKAAALSTLKSPSDYGTTSVQEWFCEVLGYSMYGKARVNPDTLSFLKNVMSGKLDVPGVSKAKAVSTPAPDDTKKTASSPVLSVLKGTVLKSLLGDYDTHDRPDGTVRIIPKDKAKRKDKGLLNRVLLTLGFDRHKSKPYRARYSTGTRGGLVFYHESKEAEMDEILSRIEEYDETVEAHEYMATLDTSLVERAGFKPTTRAAERLTSRHSALHEFTTIDEALDFVQASQLTEADPWGRGMGLVSAPGALVSLPSAVRKKLDAIIGKLRKANYREYHFALVAHLVGKGKRPDPTKFGVRGASDKEVFIRSVLRGHIKESLDEGKKRGKKKWRKDKPPHLGVQPRDYTEQQKQEVMRWMAATHTLAQLRKRQKLISAQQPMASKQKNEPALKNLHVMGYVVAGAVDLKSFGESDVVSFEESALVSQPGIIQTAYKDHTNELDEVTPRFERGDEVRLAGSEQRGIILRHVPNDDPVPSWHYDVDFGGQIGTQLVHSRRLISKAHDKERAELGIPSDRGDRARYPGCTLGTVRAHAERAGFKLTERATERLSEADYARPIDPDKWGVNAFAVKPPGRGELQVQLPRGADRKLIDKLRNSVDGEIIVNTRKKMTWLVKTPTPRKHKLEMVARVIRGWKEKSGWAEESLDEARGEGTKVGPYTYIVHYIVIGKLAGQYYVGRRLGGIAGKESVWDGRKWVTSDDVAKREELAQKFDKSRAATTLMKRLIKQYESVDEARHKHPEFRVGDEVKWKGPQKTAMTGTVLRVKQRGDQSMPGSTQRLAVQWHGKYPSVSRPNNLQIELVKRAQESLEGIVEAVERREDGYYVVVRQKGRKRTFGPFDNEITARMEDVFQVNGVEESELVEQYALEEVVSHGLKIIVTNSQGKGIVYKTPDGSVRVERFDADYHKRYRRRDDPNFTIYREGVTKAKGTIGVAKTLKQAAEMALKAAKHESVDEADIPVKLGDHDYVLSIRPDGKVTKIVKNTKPIAAKNLPAELHSIHAAMASGSRAPKHPLWKKIKWPPRYMDLKDGQPFEYQGRTWLRLNKQRAVRDDGRMMYTPLDAYSPVKPVRKFVVTVTESPLAGELRCDKCGWVGHAPFGGNCPRCEGAVHFTGKGGTPLEELFVSDTASLDEAKKTVIVKREQEDVNYRPSEKDSDKACANCAYIEHPTACKRVRGKIDPTYVCDLFKTGITESFEHMISEGHFHAEFERHKLLFEVDVKTSAEVLNKHAVEMGMQWDEHEGTYKIKSGNYEIRFFADVKDRLTAAYIAYPARMYRKWRLAKNTNADRLWKTKVKPHIDKLVMAAREDKVEA